jgi:hypothetical protein
MARRRGLGAQLNVGAARQHTGEELSADALSGPLVVTWVNERVKWSPPG